MAIINEVLAGQEKKKVIISFLRFKKR